MTPWPPSSRTSPHSGADTGPDPPPRGGGGPWWRPCAPGAGGRVTGAGRPPPTGGAIADRTGAAYAPSATEPKRATTAPLSPRPAFRARAHAGADTLRAQHEPARTTERGGGVQGYNNRTDPATLLRARNNASALLTFLASPRPEHPSRQSVPCSATLKAFRRPSGTNASQPWARVRAADREAGHWRNRCRWGRSGRCLDTPRPVSVPLRLLPRACGTLHAGRAGPRQGGVDRAGVLSLPALLGGKRKR